MKEINHILQEYHTLVKASKAMVLALVVRVEGSSYRRIGARMLVSEDGRWIGGISGGCLEGDALKRARLAMAKQKATLVTYDTTDDDPYQIGVGLGCQGIIDVLLLPIQPSQPNPISLLEDCIQARRPHLVMTQVSASSPDLLGRTWCLTSAEDMPFDELRYEAGLVFSQQKSTQIQYQGDTFLLEYLPPAIHLVVQGGNYDVYPMLRLAKELGWKVTLLCVPEKIQAQAFQWADAVLTRQAEVPIDDWTVTVLMNHDYAHDLAALQRYAATSVGYIGMLGPRKRTQRMFDENPNLQKNEPRIFSPVGLDIGATSPEEIALSILAEIKMYFSGRNAQSLRERKKPIYD
jgi:xanthine dehydrogenase accessory factor